MAAGRDFPQLLLAAQAGSGQAVERLFARHNPALRRYLEARAEGMGDDRAQEVWIAASRNLRTLTGDEGDLRSWLFSIARSKLIDQGRRSTRQPSTPTDPHVLEATSVWERPVDNLTAIEAVNELVHGLTDEQADIVLLREIGRASCRERGCPYG